MEKTARRGRMRGLVRPLAVVAALAMAATACMSSTGGGGNNAGDASNAKSAGGVINMVLAPDPVWKWLTDQGIREKMEKKSGIKILSSSSWDEFGVFAGGHADVVSSASYEAPELQRHTKVPLAVIGKYNSDRSVLMVKSGSQYKNLCDLKGQKIVSLSAVSVTIMWGVYAKKFCDLDLKAGGGDFQLVIAPIQNMAGIVARGDAAACLCMPDFSIPQLVKGELQPLYGGKSVAQIFAQRFLHDPSQDTHPQTNVFVAREAWVKKNPKEAAFLVKVWDRGIQEWQNHRNEIIAAYPEDFAVTSSKGRKFIEDWLTNQFDWFVPTAYLDQTWIDNEKKVLSLMKSSGYLPEDAPTPVFITETQLKKMASAPGAG